MVFATFAAAAHMQHLVPLAWAMRAAGHDVVVASQPDLIEEITGAGLAAVEIGADLRLSEQIGDKGMIAEPSGGPALDFVALTDLSCSQPERTTYDYLHTAFTVLSMCVYPALSSERAIGDLVDFARDWKPDLIVWDTMTFAGPVAAMATGAAHARLMFGMDMLGLARQRYRAILASRPPGRREDPVAEWLTPLLDVYGCRFDEQAVVGQWTIDPLPAALRLPVDLHYLPMRYVPYNGPATVPSWLWRESSPTRPRVCVSLGVSARDLLGGDQVSVRELLDGVADLDVDIVATLDAGQLGDSPSVPDNVRVVDFVPLNALLPTCSAIVNHGGSGTFLTALSHGVPQVIVPDMMWDTPQTAEWLEREGAGLCLPANGGLTAATLREAITRVLSEPSFAGRAEEVRRGLYGAPAPRDVVPALERLTAAYGGR